MPATVRIKGGRRIHRFVANASDPLLAVNAAYPILRDKVMPAMRSAVPFRSGKLRNSMRLRRYGTTIEFTAIWYARVVRWGNSKISVEELFLQLVEAYAPDIRAAIRAAVRAAGGL